MTKMADRSWFNANDETFVHNRRKELPFSTRPYTRLLLLRAVGRGSNDLGRDSHDLGRGMLKYKLSSP